MLSPASAASSGLAGRRRWGRGCTVEELRARRREREAALRSARRLQQLVSKRLLREDELIEDVCVGTDSGTTAPVSEQEVAELLSNAHKGTEERIKSLRRLRWGLQHKETQQTFIRLEGSMRVLIGLFTSNLADLQMEAARCLHELSHAQDPEVVEACLPATSYLLTYLSGHSTALMELCLYTLGNLAVETKVVKKQLLPQGIIPVLASCMQSPHLAVQEGAGYALSQLLQSKEAAEEIIPLVLGSGLSQHMLRLVCSDLEQGMGVAVEFAWCLHYIICSRVNNSLLVSQRTLPTLGQLLVALASTMTTTTPAEGLELLVCPVVRCVSNLLAEDEPCSGELQAQAECLLRAVFVFIRSFLPRHLFIVQECLWLLNNLTADDPALCSALLSPDLFPSLLQLLHCQKASVLVLTVLCNVAAKGPAHCQALHQKAGLPFLLGALALSDDQAVNQVLELAHLLFLHWPEAAIGFVDHSGLQALERHRDNLLLREKVEALIRIASQLAAPPQDCPLEASAEDL
ncbi:PREDICTED: LOW QUALITY PROTEIN: transmembrane and coiled-coil domain-containing protein 6 [Gekko japonicus]|uniref:LOW QUALITY PROTEIN: transmembrane and coiled-coil domain-containing protein 6 n=1 Tax=Gekko japonicus TaxID=146911 RepID=A0ABM1KVR8_GEKJA|nr:PREDICTED: LOW QUALITY PROTEIN: transmembrane and coiled-coil domain-containing protein 6 [Gekko japonicus]